MLYILDKRYSPFAISLLYQITDWFATLILNSF
ncbi:hypothetical protein [Brochothrix phage ADU4]|nr:hypothetical protein [Brochothrix phage ADU4]